MVSLTTTLNFCQKTNTHALKPYLLQLDFKRPPVLLYRGFFLNYSIKYAWKDLNPQLSEPKSDVLSN